MTKELVKRTVINLLYIQATVEGDSGDNVRPHVFEATQLINSMLGTIIAPYESDDFAAAKDHWDMLWTASAFNPQTEQRLRQLRGMAQLSRFLRNAFAHGNFQFEGKDGVVRAVVLWSSQVKRLEISIHDLQTLTLSLAALILSDGATATLVPGMLNIEPLDQPG